jgi:transcriptional regulator with XRE-family HTH domain
MSGLQRVGAANEPVVAAEIIRAARVRAELTQVELAARAGLTQSVISTYENGRREPSLVVLQRLLRAAGFAWRMELEPIESPPSRRELVAAGRSELLDVLAALGGRNVRLCEPNGRADDDFATVVELLVDLDPGCGLFALMRMQDEAERILARRVSVVAADVLDARAFAAAVRDAVPV